METFQVLGLNDAYWDRTFSSLPAEVLEKLKAGAGCMVRNPLPMIYEGEEIPRTEIHTGDVLQIAGREVTVLDTLDGYESYLSVGNNGFINGVQVIVNEELYAALTGKTAYNWLLPTLSKGVERAGAYYGLIASVLGGALGYLCAVFVSAATTDTLQLVPVPVSAILEASALAVGACLLATCAPLHRVGSMSTVEAIEGVE